MTSYACPCASPTTGQPPPAGLRKPGIDSRGPLPSEIWLADLGLKAVNVRQQLPRLPRQFNAVGEN